jgi:flagellar biosynthesis GTPase FlhF
MLEDDLGKIIEFVTGPSLADEVYKAKEEYRRNIGDVFEDDKSFENRMTLFLEWYVFDRFMTNQNLTPLHAFVEKNREIWPPEVLKTYTDLTRHIHGIFIVKKIRKTSVTVLNLFDKATYEVSDAQSEIIFRRNDIFEGRIVPYGLEMRFTGAYCFHPRETLKFIRREIDKVNDELHKTEKELKKMRSEESRLDNDINKFQRKIQDMIVKIDKCRTPEKKTVLEFNKSGLEQSQTELETKRGELREKIRNLIGVKIEREAPEARNKLMQKLSYMNLKWERFRQIDLKDIYRL